LAKIKHSAKSSLPSAAGWTLSKSSSLPSAAKKTLGKKKTLDTNCHPLMISRCR
jgi:hypothetical protein